ncbi:unnamed protein product [Adineta steineri]|uniref:PARP catalytic domain-containing protein n=1 Tax=Adineta steineri TaxID=433720 RepID=A0A818SCR8_9BILA|nr:unnamed protein product [Adineta steineri]CAF3669251.1 unnamed protein product [Adineta steineri]
MLSTDDSTSMTNSTDSPPDHIDDVSILSNDEELGDDEDQASEDDEMNDEVDVDSDDEEEEIAPIQSRNNSMTIPNPIPTGSNSSLNSLLEEDINNLFSKVPTKFLAGASHKLDINDSRLLLITLHFFTDFIETETSCQWQICNKKPLTCQISIDKKHYLDEPVTVKCVYQTCECHPANAFRVPFIERLIRDFFDKNRITLETLKYSRAAFDPVLRLKYFLDILPPSKRTHYEGMLINSNDDTLLNELLAFEILENNQRIAQKLQLIKPPRNSSSDTTKHYDLLNEKHLPTLNYGYLVQFCYYFEYRLKNLNSLCVMCGKRTVSLNDIKKTSKPTICDDYECFSNAMDSKFRNDPLPPSIFSIEIADFLLLLLIAAIKSTRHGLILDPYPKLINPYNTSTTLIDQDGDKEQNIKTLREIIDGIISMGSITQYEVDRISLRSTLELKHPWAFSFFHWLMGTNRYHFSAIPSVHRMKSVQTDYQYFIKHEDIVKHVNFKRLRDEKGSIFAFHGSPQENWHSILRSGLQIGKGGYLLNGAAHGAGIYVSPSFDFSTSYVRNSRYSQPESTGGNNYSYGREIAPLERQNWGCIALCEIIDSPDVYKKHSADIWTIQDPNLICTRFIFFYPSGICHTSIRVDNAAEAASIRQLIHTLNNTAC